MSQVSNDLKSIDELVKVVLDTSRMYKNSIAHYFNGRIIPILYSLERLESCGLNSTPREDLRRAFEQFKDGAVIYYCLLKEYSSRPGDIPESVGRETLIQLLSQKYFGDLNRLVEAKDDTPTNIRNIVTSIVDNELDGARELKLSLPFIKKIRDGSYSFPCPEQEVRDEVVRDLGSLPTQFKEKLIFALGTVSSYSGSEEIRKQLFALYTVLEGLPQIKYAPAEDAAGKSVGLLSFEQKKPKL